MATAVAARQVATTTGGKRRIIFPILAGLVALLGFVLLDGVREARDARRLEVGRTTRPGHLPDAVREVLPREVVGNGLAVRDLERPHRAQLGDLLVEAHALDERPDTRLDRL